ncbi:MAG: hypothetical protein VB009_08350 [Erysipelotrichaceae bacterium]|nr:hypothetical protein [Erysipelotrichaceae bacterium]
MNNRNIFNEKGNPIGGLVERVSSSSGLAIIFGILAVLGLVFTVMVWPIIFEDHSFSLFTFESIWLLSFPISSTFAGVILIFFIRKLNDNRSIIFIISYIFSSIVTILIATMWLKTEFWTTLIVCSAMSVIPSYLIVRLLYLMRALFLKTSA